MAVIAGASLTMSPLLHHTSPPPNRPKPSNFPGIIPQRQRSCSYGLISIKATKLTASGGSSGGGSGVLERPPLDSYQFETSFAKVLQGGDIGRLRDKNGHGNGDSYKVLLVDDARHSENLVAKVLPQVVPSVTPDDAKRMFRESREKGMSVVIVTVKEHAEFYVQMMIRGGLHSTMEPDSRTV